MRSDDTGMPVTVPSYAAPFISAAARASGLPFDLVACHVNAESGFDARAISPDGKQGAYQITPAAFYDAWHGSPFSWADSTVAYGVIMSALLRQYSGDVRRALAAYHAGAGALGAAIPWAESVLECAGYHGLAFGGNVAPELTAAELTDPDVQSDDWSWYVGQASVWLNDIGSIAGYWANYIGRL